MEPKYGTIYLHKHNVGVTKCASSVLKGRQQHKLSKLQCRLAANLGDFRIKAHHHVYSFMEHMSNVDLNFEPPAMHWTIIFYFSKILGDVMVRISEIQAPNEPNALRGFCGGPLETFLGSGYYTWLSGDKVINDDGKGRPCSKIGGTRNLTWPKPEV
ncbi:hypothetical protein I309_01619 [Cryptococcus deuterogattii LA55]|nr:hypothetical protein I309_01619 [Cryptococcus deuterogattii LA55]KIR93404.1 hypothetical protein I304_03073 [Cryptococcus deuterogattii CBS 10090]KIR99333.1 hypothetical protein L804_02958 [Cryptococcus deuterogattii 2001/935-1]